MENFLQVILLGIIEGITEFTHLQYWPFINCRAARLRCSLDVFNIVIQAGAILAVTVIYWQRIWQLMVNIREPENQDYAMKLGAAFLVTIVLMLIATKLGFKLPTELRPIAWALVIGGVWMIVAEIAAAKKTDTSIITWPVAVIVGVAQAVAGIFPAHLGKALRFLPLCSLAPAIVQLPLSLLF